MAKKSGISRVVEEIHDIRQQIHEETKDMSPEELSAYYERSMREAEKLCGAKFRRAPVRDAS